MKNTLITFATLFYISFTVSGQTLDSRINSIYNEIARIRKNPCEYAHLYDYDICEFEPTKRMLKYDEKLAKEAEEYSRYLYRRSKKIINDEDILVHSPAYVICNESLAYLPTPLICVKAWISEYNYNGDGHRLHIMNAKPCHKTDTKIGIGITCDVENGMYFIVLRTK